ncbi:MAG: DUF4115 domain-containing protein [Deferribacteraceae bacterium]|jgi:cytoskeletal protein RodZ|nr:DUF4115 domain-containing protein [Deferribacteraceae bacterium]
MGKLGNYLKEVRESRKLTIQDVSKATAVRQHFLELLEQGRYEELPSYVHVHGFLSQYSKFLGLDFQNAIKPLLDEECPKESYGKTIEELEQENEVKKNSSSFSAAQIISSVMVLLIIVLVGYVIYTSGLSSKRSASRATAPNAGERVYSTEPPAVVAVTPIYEEPEVLPLIDNKTNTVDTPRAESAAVANTTVNPPAVPSNNRAPEPFNTVILRFTEECWFHFMADNDNSTAVDLIAGAGTSRTVQFKSFFLLDIGNAGGMTLQHNNKNYTGFGASGQPLKNVYFRVDENGVLQQSRTPPAME